jgi:osmotically inducible lipoprotein OsmB
MSFISIKSVAAAAALVTAVALSACGTTPGDRAVSGGLLGAGAGAAIGSLSGNAGTGALIGGAAGAVTGAVTDPCRLNLGDPWWRQNGGDEAYYARCGRP